jgi:hypothetical protein
LGRQNKAILQQVVDMQPLLFFSRVTFICNVCFILTWLFYFIPSLGDGHVVSTILVLGVVVAVVLNITINCIIIVLLLLRKPLWPFIPKWLVIFNLICLILQIIFFPA